MPLNFVLDKADVSIHLSVCNIIIILQQAKVPTPNANFGVGNETFTKKRGGVWGGMPEFSPMKGFL